MTFVGHIGAHVTHDLTRSSQAIKSLQEHACCFTTCPEEAVLLTSQNREEDGHRLNLVCSLCVPTTRARSREVARIHVYSRWRSRPLSGLEGPPCTPRALDAFGATVGITPFASSACSSSCTRRLRVPLENWTCRARGIAPGVTPRRFISGTFSEARYHDRSWVERVLEYRRSALGVATPTPWSRRRHGVRSER